MEVSAGIWAATVVLIAGLLAFDFFFHVRKAHVPTLKEASIWSALYVGIALLFGAGLLIAILVDTAGDAFRLHVLNAPFRRGPEVSPLLSVTLPLAGS